MAFDSRISDSFRLLPTPWFLFPVLFPEFERLRRRALNPARKQGVLNHFSLVTPFNRFEGCSFIDPAEFWIVFALFLACVAGFVFFGWRYRQAVRRNVQQKNDLIKAVAFAVAATVFLAVFTAFYYADLQAQTNAGKAEFASLAAIAASAESSSAGLRLVDYKLETFSRQITPVSCEGARELVYWRELRVYNVTRIDAEGKTSTAYYSTITLTLRNEGDATFYDVVVRERIPSEIAADPSDVINFSLTPLRVVKGSVVADWLFTSIKPGETKSVSYTVEKRVSVDVLDNVGAPGLVVKLNPGAEASPSPEPSAAGAALSFQWIYVIPLFLVLALIALYFEHMYKKQLQAEE